MNSWPGDLWAAVREEVEINDNHRVVLLFWGEVTRQVSEGDMKNTSLVLAKTLTKAFLLAWGRAWRNDGCGNPSCLTD